MTERYSFEEEMTAQEHYELIKRYLVGCFQRKDWHGVMDAAADIRELLARHGSDIDED